MYVRCWDLGYNNNLCTKYNSHNNMKKSIFEAVIILYYLFAQDQLKNVKFSKNI